MRLGRDRLGPGVSARMGQESVAEHFGALAELREAGLVRHLGLSDVEPHHLAEAQAIAPVSAVENRFGLDSHNPATDELLRVCGEQGIAFSADVLHAVAGKQGPQAAADSHDEEVLAVARAHDATPTQVRIAWTLHQGPHVLAIPGTSNPDHLAENVTARLRLTDDELRASTPCTTRRADATGRPRRRAISATMPTVASSPRWLGAENFRRLPRSSRSHTCAHRPVRRVSDRSTAGRPRLRPAARRARQFHSWCAGSEAFRTFGRGR